jgi:hypothetical protein
MATLNKTKQVEFMGGETLPEVGSPEYLQAQSGVIPTGSTSSTTPIPTTITSADLSSTEKPLKLAPTVISSNANDIMQTADISNKAIKTRNADELAQSRIASERQAEQDRLSAEYQSILGQQGQLGAKQLGYEQEAGISKDSKASDELASRIEAKQLAATRQIEALEKNPQGLFGGGLQQEITRIERESAREIADLSIAQNAINRQLLTAQTLVNQKIALETQDLKTKADNLRFFYTENKELLTKAEDREYSNLVKQADREYNDEKEKLAKLESTKLALLKSAAEQGAPNELLQSIQTSKTPEEAITKAGRYGGDILERLTKQKQLENIQSEINKRNNENKPVFLDTEGKIVVDRTEAQKVSKELVSNDAYKAIQKSKDSLLYLKNFEEALNEFGSTSEVFDPIKNSELKAKYNAATLNLKEFFNLGVLNGPDLSIIQGVLPNPSDTSNFRKFVQLGTYQPGTASSSGLNSIKKMVETTLDDRYKSIRTQYSPYSPQSVAALADANRIYIEQKSALNPNIQQLVDENPNLSDEEILTIMGI